MQKYWHLFCCRLFIVFTSLILLYDAYKKFLFEIFQNFNFKRCQILKKTIFVEKCWKFSKMKFTYLKQKFFEREKHVRKKSQLPSIISKESYIHNLGNYSKIYWDTHFQGDIYRRLFMKILD